MSHFTVLVQMNDDFVKESGNIENAVGRMLAPYQENNMGDCPVEYLEFNDMTHEVEEAANEVIKEGFYMAEEHPDFIGKKILDFYGSKEEVASEHCGYRKDEKTGKFGYWENPNAKWDWWSIGGRWREMLRIKEASQSHVRGDIGVPELLSLQKNGEKHKVQPHAADGAQKKDIDFEGMDLEVQVRIDEWWNKWLEFEKTGKDDGHPAFFGIVFDLIKMGLKKPVVETVLRRNKANRKFIEMGDKVNEEHRKELATKLPPVEYITKEFTKEDIERDYRWYFELNTYAVLTEDGEWHSQGDMGWFGLSSDDADDRNEWGKSFVERFIKNAKDDDWFVIVDCHI